MFTLKIENAAGLVFELSHNTQNYTIAGVQGLTRPQTAINTSTGGGTDGSFFNSARVEQRNIVIDLILNGDIEENRQQLYNIFPMRSPCVVYFSNKNRDVKIQGYVEALEGDLFVQQERMQISIICPRPFFEDLEALYTELADLTRMFEFPFAIEAGEPIPLSEMVSSPTCIINNRGDVATGFTMSLAVITSYTGQLAPLTKFTIINSTTGEFFGITYGFRAGDKITVCTKAGQLSAKAVLQATGETVNLLPYMTAGSAWMKLIPGENELTFTKSISVQGTALDVEFETVNLYGGV